HTFDVENENFQLRNIMEAPLLQNKEDIEDVCISAVKERDIEGKLKQVVSDWSVQVFTFSQFKTRGELLLKGADIQEIVALMEDSLMMLASLMSNRYNAPFKPQIQSWVHKLSGTTEIIENWLVVQNLWVYLEAVFVGGDIAKQLPQEAKRFANIDKSWQKIMQKAHETTNVVQCCMGDDTLAQLLPHLLEQLEMCQKSLTGYLEKKRLLFPRFFFVSDPALLEILGQASDSHTIQAHLLSLFDNVYKVDFDEKVYDKIIRIRSQEDEVVDLESPVMAQGNVEVWLKSLLDTVLNTVHCVIRKASQAVNDAASFKLVEFSNVFPAQISQLGIQMLWTKDAETSLTNAKSDKKAMATMNQRFLDMLNELINTTTTELTKYERTKFETLVTIHVHQRDIFDDMVGIHMCRMHIKSPSDFEWLKQSRFYFIDDTDRCLVQITDVDFDYCNEYTGCTDRLVITPLTDRCYITLAQALGMSMGGAPAGPAGTGKTETTKDMGKCLGKYVVVFNCSDQMDYRGLGRIYKGLAQSGSWGCFDEFNRIELPVLSVAAQQIAIVLQCKKMKKPQFVFTDGDVVDLDKEFGIFLTMNPGYAGRQELPENLKIIFRPVAMMVPDRSIIIRVKLAACGFIENIVLSKKFYTLYKLCEEQLSKQVHYDFGLRNILSVLRTLGGVKRANPEDPEPMIVMRVLRDMNLSKLVDEDEPLFLSLINDLFPGIQLDKAGYPDLEAAIEKQILDAGLINHPPWVLKLIQLFETQRVRHGMMALGPSGAGKTKCIHTLMKAMTDCGEPHREMRMNPKAITAPQMFGTLDVATNDWTDGIFSTLWRRTHKAKKVFHIWLVLDGPVDAIWIENLNSVLDDNKTLTLANGDRIPMAPNCKIIFEPHNIDNASPATVSRNGMVFMSSSVLDWQPILKGWLQTLPMQQNNILMDEFESIFQVKSPDLDSLDFLFSSCFPKMDFLECMYIRQAIDILQVRLLECCKIQIIFTNIKISVGLNVYFFTFKPPYFKQPPIPPGLIPSQEESKQPNSEHLKRLFFFSLMWSVGAILELDDRAKLEEFIKNHENKLAIPPIQDDETIFDLVVWCNAFFSTTRNTPVLPFKSNPVLPFIFPQIIKSWEHWGKRVPQYNYPKDSVPDYMEILVPNVDNVRTDFLMQTIMQQVRHVLGLLILSYYNLPPPQEKGILLIGEQGTAKTVMIKGYSNRYDPEHHLSKALNFSSATTPNMFQRTVESYVDKRVGTTYGPPAGKKMTVFIDDINMPVVNNWGDQITNEIVRQLMATKGFYSIDKPGDFTNIVDIQFVAAMIHPVGGGRNDIPQRLKRQLCIFNCTLPSNNSIDKIFSTIGEGYFCKPRGFTAEVVELIPKLVPLTRRLWQATKVKMLPTPAKFHYIFNLRDLSRIWQGILNVDTTVGSTVEVLLGLWKHECHRVVADRFTNQPDKDWFAAALDKNIVYQHIAFYIDFTNNIFNLRYFLQMIIDNFFHRNISKTLTLVFVKGMFHLDDILLFEKHSTKRYFTKISLILRSWRFCYIKKAYYDITGEEDDADLEAPKIYEPIESFDQLEEKLKVFQEQYNETIRGSKMDLVFFKDAMVHLVKISRIIRTPRGNCLLVGVGGSGKQSLTRLATYIAGYESFQITLSRTYNVANLIDDLKILYRKTGKEGKGVSFIFTDNEIKDEGFLEYMNNVLASGEVSNLFARDEIDEITQELVPVMKAEYPRRPPTNENLYEYFLSRVRANLHVVLCFSPVGEKFQNRALKFPALISGCTMDWFLRWPRDALIQVAQYFLEVFPMECDKNTKGSIVQVMGTAQDIVAEKCVEYFERYRRACHVTPKSYLSFLAGYKTIYKSKLDDISVLSSRMKTGLLKLVEAEKSVNELSKELAVKEKDLAVASKEADQVLKVVTVKATAAEKVKAEVQKVKDKAQHIVDSIAVDKISAEAKLTAAKPALEAAEAALQTIKPADIATVRKLGKPPHLIMRIMDCVLLLFQKRINPVEMDPDRPCVKPSWSEALKMMNNSGFLQSLLNFSKDTITEETVELLAPYLDMDDYSFESAKKVCGNVAGLCSWTQAMSFFYSINKEVLPLKANLIIQEARLGKANADLNEAQATLDEKQAELNEVQAMYDKAIAHKQALIDDAEACKRKMVNASALIEGLGGEKIRWTAAGKTFQDQITRLVGDVLLATGFLSYSGPFNQDFRNLLQTAWKKEMAINKIPFSDDINLISMLVDNATIGEWNLQGLPNDDLSVQNGIIVTRATRYPLLIDPQGQGKIWVRNKEMANELQITTLNHKYFRTHLEDALSLGRPLLIEDVGEELDPALDNVLEQNFIKSGSTFKVKVGDKEVDVMKGFLLYITTKLANPVYTPEVYARTSIIDFTVTMKGLEDQLLGRVILTEKQELESERVALMEEVTANKRKMKELEDNLLFRLTSTQGSLVEDESLIQVLQTTKVTAEEVSDKLTIAADTEVKINTAREEFRPVATRGSILYFLIVEMSLVNVMYQTSLRQFLQLFDLALARSAKSPIPSKRILNIIEYLTYDVFRYTSRGLYEEHKFLYVLLLTLKIALNTEKITHTEFQTFIKGGWFFQTFLSSIGGASLDLNAVDPKPKKWILDMTWLNLVQLSRLQQFSQLLNQISRNDKVRSIPYPASLCLARRIDSPIVTTSKPASQFLLFNQQKFKISVIIIKLKIWGWKAWFDEEAPEEATIPEGYSSSLDTFRKLLLIRAWCPDRITAQARHFIASTMGEKYTEAVLLDYEKMLGESEKTSPMICFLTMGSDPTDNIERLARGKGIPCRAISMGQGQEVHARRLLTQCFSDGGWLLLQNCHLGLAYMEELLEQLQTNESINDQCRTWITAEVHAKFPINLLQSSIKYTNEPPQGCKAGLKRTYSAMNQVEFLDISNMPQWKPLLFTVAFLYTTVQERRKFGPLGWNIPYEYNQADFTTSVQFIQNHLDDLDIKKGVSWNTVRYMLGEIQFGGRVTDDLDKHLLNTYCKVWFGEHIFAEKFCFYKGVVLFFVIISLRYTIPRGKSIAEYHTHIDNLPLVDTPEVMGLHPNADITYQTNFANLALGTIVSIQPKESSGGAGETRESVVFKMADEMLEKLPANFLPHEKSQLWVEHPEFVLDVFAESELNLIMIKFLFFFQVKARLQKMGSIQPMNIFLRQELDRMQRVISVVRTTLIDLKLAIDGTIIMSENLRDALDQMFDARIPNLWQKISWECSTLGFWFTELLERHIQFHSWIFDGRPNQFWMTGFFNPQGFLTAMRQEVTRAHTAKGWALDGVVLYNEVTRMMKEDITAPPPVEIGGVYVYGLFLDGAGWDRRNVKLVEPSPKVLFTSMPVVHVYAINTASPVKDDKKGAMNIFHCPVYKKPRRTDLTYVFPLLLKTVQSPEHWTLRGVAILCDTK
uniref:AAA+ ATPase domain-containing protein n=1 Tax=Ciona savignyi TaxID=51511 RepID=H2ZRC3_CIOSA